MKGTRWEGKMPRKREGEEDLISKLVVEVLL